MKDYIINDDGSVECRECGCVSTKEQYEDGDCQHWGTCSVLSDEADFSGASTTEGQFNDR